METTRKNRKLTDQAFTEGSDVELLGKETVYDGFFTMERLTLRHRLYEGGWSEPFSRELFVRGPAVGVLLYDPDRELIGLIEQFRVGALGQPNSPWLLEVVAGMVEAGESAEEVARRELFEEAGIEQVELEPICEYLVSPGGSNETIKLFCGLTDLEHSGGCYGVAGEHEDILLCVVPEAEAFNTLNSGRCNNAATIVCLQWLMLNRELVHKNWRKKSRTIGYSR
ncbi:MAG: NUDIX domain-containing protein [Porticoccaceae bacterium]|nr:NUDIX domain-containing protein [Porticoccaceae bacterium]